MPEERLIICPECKFPNMPGALSCLTCKAPLKGGTRVVPRPNPTERVPAGIADTPTRPFVRAKGGGLLPAEPRPHDPPRPGEGPIVGWLRCEPLPPIALGPKRAVTMGRGSDCDLILPHSTVSRIHAIVRVLGRQLAFEDRSSFGSYLNGKPVSSTQLSFGDRIGIGPYEVRVLGPDGADLEPSNQDVSEEHTQPLDFTSFRQVPAEAELLGSLDRVSLLEILQTLELHMKTGKLKVTSGSEAGELAVEEGRPLSASLGLLKDDTAILAMLKLRAGSFCFFAVPVDEEMRTMSGTLTRLLLEASRQQDESGLDELGETHPPDAR